MLDFCYTKNLKKKFQVKNFGVAKSSEILLKTFYWIGSSSINLP